MIKAYPIVPVQGWKLPSKVIVVSTLAKVAEREAVEDVREGSGWVARSAAPQSRHEKGSMGAEILGEGGATLV